MAHLINLATPVPAPFAEAVTAAGHLLPRVFEPIDRVALGGFGLALVLPGMALMFVLWVRVRALSRRAGTGGILLSIGAQYPNPADLEEQQLVNVLQEMTIAAGGQDPRPTRAQPRGGRAGPGPRHHRDRHGGDAGGCGADHVGDPQGSSAGPCS